jgi:deferrochelatase/peroxidase EfeB
MPDDTQDEGSQSSETMAMPEDRIPRGPALSRRRLLLTTGSVVGAGAIGAVAGYGWALGPLAPQAALASGTAATSIVPFDALHQAGIVTPAQDRLAFASFDVTTTSRDALIALLRGWTAAARQMTQGLPVGNVGGNPALPPLDTGEALGLPAANLTITIGFGPSLFDGRFGLGGRRPAALADMPAFPGDALEPDLAGGDLCIQACSDDPLVCFHATHNLARLALGSATIRWFQLGFGRTSSTSSAQVTPRNLQGFKDGTNNIVGEDADALTRFVWVGDETDQPWMREGSYLVARRVRMRIESWDRTALGEQEAVIGRDKTTGAPLGGTAEHDPVDLAATDAVGSPVIPDTAHIRMAAPSTNADQRILRRGYSFTDGIDPVTGELDAGLFFVAFQKDPRSQFVAIQRRLAASDALNEYIRHTGSGLFACPPGTSPDGWWGDGLFSD